MLLHRRERISFLLLLAAFLALICSPAPATASSSENSNHTSKARMAHPLLSRLFAADSPVTTDGSCGTTTRCAAGDCCSQYGWCGNTDTYCGTGCQAAWGTCGSPAATTTAAAGSPTVSLTQCGAALNMVCGPGLCCSQWGWCGATTDHCNSQCQLSWGATCSLPTTSAAASSGSSAPASNFRVVSTCTQPNQVAITFDDGLGPYASAIVDTFAQNAPGAKVSFFVNGNNYDCLYNHYADLKKIYAAGHQIASHTWSHPDLVTLTSAQVADEMNKLTGAFQKMLGFAPLYMRPPFGSHNAAVDAVVESLGFRVLALWDVDPGDANGAAYTAQQAAYTSAAAGSHIALNHDPQQKTATQLVPFIINWAQQRGLKMVTIGECLGETDPALWYTPTVTTATTGVKDATWVC